MNNDISIPTLKNMLVTGGCGFIGSNFIRYLLEKTNFKGRIINIDNLTYAGNPDNLTDIITRYSQQYVFKKIDITDYPSVLTVFQDFSIDTVVHFAAESHVDRSIHGPAEFIQTNIQGTFNLIEAARHAWTDLNGKVFHHVSTDEVYGSLENTGQFHETTPYDPHSPYSASKASSDHIVKAYFHTFKLPIKVSNCSNNYGPYQFPEKLIPLMILNAVAGKPLPVYGDGKNIRDWLYVEDHCSAIWTIIQQGKIGETYNIGGENEIENIAIIYHICEIIEKLLPIKTNQAIHTTQPKINSYLDLITYVKDRPGHDRRYAMNIDKIKSELRWSPAKKFPEGIRETIDWYLNHPQWIQNIQTGAYRQWLEINYNQRS
jgi:dTDP-glucose 4,6-dehydratase